MRTLEDWFRYLEQQYVDEKKQKEEAALPPQQQHATEPKPNPPVQITSRDTATEPQKAKTEPVSERRPSAISPVLEQVPITETTVPDPADYIFTLRRPANEPPASPQPPATVEATEAVEAIPEVESAAPEAAEVAEEQSSGEEPVTAEAGGAPAVEEQHPAGTEAVISAEASSAEDASASEGGILPETAEQTTEMASRDRRIRRAPYTRSVRPVPPPQTIEELWKRVPKHVRLLVELGDDEVTQRYYDRQFKESRQELVERLLNPSLTLEDTARLLGVCPTTVRRYTERGLLNHYRTPGNQRRFRLSDVIAFLEARQQAHEARRRRKR